MTDVVLWRNAQGNNKQREDAPVDLLAHVRQIPVLRKRRRWQTCAIASCVLWLGTCAIACNGMIQHQSWTLLMLWLLVITGSAGFLVAADLYDSIAVRSLAKYHDPFALGSLICCAGIGRAGTRRAVSGALLRMLPRLTPSDTGYIENRHRRRLHSLMYGADAEVSMAVLAALEQIGDASSLPILSAISSGKSVPPSLRKHKAEVGAQAQKAIEAIRVRLDARHRAHELLRGSGPPSVNTSQLLRLVPTKAASFDSELLKSIQCL